MHTVELIGCAPDLDAEALVALVRSYSDLSLQASIREVDRLVNGGTLALPFDSRQDARMFQEEAEAIGVYVDGR